MLVHPLARAPETRLTHYLVAGPGDTVDGAKYITRSPRRLNIRQRWPDTTTHVPAIPWLSSPNHTEGAQSLHFHDSGNSLCHNNPHVYIYKYLCTCVPIRLCCTVPATCCQINILSYLIYLVFGCTVPATCCQINILSYLIYLVHPLTPDNRTSDNGGPTLQYTFQPYRGPQA